MEMEDELDAPLNMFLDGLIREGIGSEKAREIVESAIDAHGEQWKDHIKLT